jgi:hypothetical protein
MADRDRVKVESFLVVCCRNTTLKSETQRIKRFEK